MTLLQRLPARRDGVGGGCRSGLVRFGGGRCEFGQEFGDGCEFSADLVLESAAVGCVVGGEHAESFVMGLDLAAQSFEELVVDDGHRRNDLSLQGE
jgi:hypothetical protein